MTFEIKVYDLRARTGPWQGVAEPRLHGCRRSLLRLGQPSVPAIRWAAWVSERGSSGHVVRFTEPVIGSRTP